jgi:Tfp pilus assembly protein PilV
VRIGREWTTEGGQTARAKPAFAGLTRRSPLGPRHGPAAFTLMEVMIAGGILFMCLFAILALVANSLSNARALQRMPVDPAGSLAAAASLNQRLIESSDSGDFGDLYPDYRWTAATNQIATNGLFQVDFVVYRRGDARAVLSRMSILLYRPDSPRTPLKQ